MILTKQIVSRKKSDWDFFGPLEIEVKRVKKII